MHEFFLHQFSREQVHRVKQKICGALVKQRMQFAILSGRHMWQSLILTPTFCYVPLLKWIITLPHGFRRHTASLPLPIIHFHGLRSVVHLHYISRSRQTRTHTHTKTKTLSHCERLWRCSLQPSLIQATISPPTHCLMAPSPRRSATLNALHSFSLLSALLFAGTQFYTQLNFLS